jgi:hypothetical protein
MSLCPQVPHVIQNTGGKDFSQWLPICPKLLGRSQEPHISHISYSESLQVEKGPVVSRVFLEDRSEWL